MTVKHKDNLLDVVSTIMKWRRPLILLCIIAGIVSLIVSFGFLKDHYKASTIFYAASPELAKPEQIFGGSKGNQLFWSRSGCGSHLNDSKFK